MAEPTSSAHTTTPRRPHAAAARRRARARVGWPRPRWPEPTRPSTRTRHNSQTALRAQTWDSPPGGPCAHTTHSDQRASSGMHGSPADGAGARRQGARGALLHPSRPARPRARQAACALANRRAGANWSKRAHAKSAQVLGRPLAKPRSCPPTGRVPGRGARSLPPQAKTNTCVPTGSPLQARPPPGTQPREATARTRGRPGPPRKPSPRNPRARFLSRPGAPAGRETVRQRIRRAEARARHCGKMRARLGMRPRRVGAQMQGSATAAGARPGRAGRPAAHNTQ